MCPMSRERSAGATSQNCKLTAFASAELSICTRSGDRVPETSIRANNAPRPDWLTIMASMQRPRPTARSGTGARNAALGRCSHKFAGANSSTIFQASGAAWSIPRLRRGCGTGGVLEAMRRVPREEFVEAVFEELLKRILRCRSATARLFLSPTSSRS